MAFIKNKIKYAVLIFAGILILLLIWGVVIEPRLIDFREESVSIPNLPKVWEGKRVALIADLQIGMWLGNEGTVKKIVNQIIEARPAAVFVAGDFVYKPTDEDERDDVEREDTHDFMGEVNESAALLRPLTNAGIPVYAVLGNHDYGMNYPESVKNQRLANAVRQTLEANKITVLENSAVKLELSNKNDLEMPLYIVGIGSRYAGNDKPEIALSQIPENAPRIILMHNPDSFGAIPANAAPLALAGHTHGGQIRIPFTPDWSWMALASSEEIHGDGWIDDNFGQAGNRLYVNRGIGFSSFPVRINCRPEVTFFTLRSENN